MKVQIPASVDEAVSKLGSLGKLLTATEWERAAILAAFVEIGSRGGDTTGGSIRETPNAFAKRGIVGLRDDKTVAHYVKAWMAEVGTRPALNADVELPTLPFPGAEKNNGAEADKQKSTAGMARALNAQVPDAAKALVERMTPEAKHVLAAELAEDDFLTVNRALEQSSTAKEIDRELARSRKGKEARDDKWCDTQSPLDARALATLAFDVIPTIEGLISKIKARGMDEDAGRHALAYADKITALMGLLRAQVSGDLDPMDVDEFDRQVQSILDGVA